MKVTKLKVTKLFKDFTESEKSGGLLLIVCTILSLLLGNSNFGTDHNQFWETQFVGHSIRNMAFLI